MQVVAGGTCDKCGVKTDDVIEAMNGATTNKMTIAQAQNIVKTAGLKFTMNVTRFLDVGCR